MRRFSQRNSLVTLSDINITPLLDLAFVLLIIFIIISPSIKSKENNSMDLTLPKGGGPSQKIDPKDVNLVEISPQGQYSLNRQPMDLAGIERTLVATYAGNPNLIVKIRADQDGRNRDLYAIIDLCLRNGITQFSWGTTPARR